MNEDWRPSVPPDCVAEPMVTVAFKPASLTVAECFRAGAEGRFPDARVPLLRMVLGLLSLVLALAVLGLIVGMTVWPWFRAESVAATFAVIGASGLVLYFAGRIRWARRRYRDLGPVTLTLKPSGFSWWSAAEEYQARWQPGHRIVLARSNLLLFKDRQLIAWLPRRAFAAPEAEEDFVAVGRQWLAAAVGSPVVGPEWSTMSQGGTP